MRRSGDGGCDCPAGGRRDDNEPMVVEPFDDLGAIGSHSKEEQLAFLVWFGEPEAAADTAITRRLSLNSRRARTAGQRV